ncbi:hypothetical protein [Bremerella alba]|uniref:Uncharacterized protein n=1 Tax=Bremerella alba TaxID=980252 RepID=A0A7V9A9Y3_9BACT|nr:hypothetical protein [Bremerella alba]MBA2117962.1 hypothetical protein [Bremerella alba]
MTQLRIELIEHPDYLEFVCSGDHVPEDWEDLIKQAHVACQRTGKTRVLIEGMSLDSTLDNMTRYRVGLLVGELFGPEYRIAALMPQEHINYFWETVAHNRGSKVKTASDYAMLMDWLNEED